MTIKIFFKHLLIIVPITIIITFLATKFNWFSTDFSVALIFKVLTIFALTCVFMNLFKDKIKSSLIFLFIVLGTVAGYFLTLDLLHYKTVHIVLFLSYLLIAILFGWGANVVKNRFIRVSFWFIGIFYIQLSIMNESDLKSIDWLMYIPAFVLGIWTCKKYDYEKKLLFLPLLLFFLNFIFEFSLIFLIEGSFSLDKFAIYVFSFQMLTFLSLWLAYCCGFWFIKSKKMFVKILLPIFVILLALFLLNQVRSLLLQRFENNTWTGEVSKPAKLSEIEFFTDSTLNKVTINDLNKKIYVLGFSNPGCGHCFRQMPKFQQLMEKYEKNTEIGFYTIYVYNNITDIAWFQRYTEKNNITIPHLFINIKDSVYRQTFGYNSFPQYNIVKNDTIIFDGYFEILDFFERKYLK